jgi:hypothetical protein
MKHIRIIILLLRFQPIFERATSLAPSDLAPQERQQEAHRYIDWARKAAPEIACFGNRRADLWAEWSECSLEDVTPDEQCPHARKHFAEGGMSQNLSKWSQTPQLTVLTMSLASGVVPKPGFWIEEDRPNAVDYGWTQLDSKMAPGAPPSVWEAMRPETAKRGLWKIDVPSTPHDAKPSKPNTCIQMCQATGRRFLNSETKCRSCMSQRSHRKESNHRPSWCTRCWCQRTTERLWRTKQLTCHEGVH